MHSDDRVNDASIRTSAAQPAGRPGVEGFPYGSGPALEAVEATMLRIVRGTTPDLASEMVEEHLMAGGKRMRARIALAALQHLGRVAEEGVAWAAACELLHNATLIHDDAQDGDEFRRGRETVWKKYGVPQAINAGDLLQALAIRVVACLKAPAPVKADLCCALATAAEDAVRGQTLEMNLHRVASIDRRVWERAAEGKTGALFGLPVEGAALIADLGTDAAKRLARPFRQIGVLFQIDDDLLDVYEAKGGRQAGNDIREGKVSALVVEHLRIVPADREWLFRILKLPRDKTPDEDVREALRRYRDQGAVDALLNRMRELTTAIADDPVWRGRRELRDMAQALMGVAKGEVDRATGRATEVR